MYFECVGVLGVFVEEDVIDVVYIFEDVICCYGGGEVLCFFLEVGEEGDDFEKVEVDGEEDVDGEVGGVV